MSVTEKLLDERMSKRRKDNATTIASWSSACIGALTVVLLASFVALTLNLRRQSCHRPPYNSTPIGEETVLDDGSHRYEIAVITDLDGNSKDESKKHQWRSFLRKGVMIIGGKRSVVSIVWDPENEISLYSMLAAGGRSMELSDLVVFDGKLLSIDDRTGIIYRINGSDVFPWVILADGAGDVVKGFKGEWMTVKNNELWVGGLGKEWTTTDGVFVNYNPMWVKRVTHDGRIEHIDWVENYKKVRSSVGIKWPGYMIHESVQWSDIYKSWFFLPRRASNLMYTEAEDEERGTNYLLVASEDFATVRALQVGTLHKSRGFSAFQFVPGTDDQLIIALKTEEKDGAPVCSYVTVFEHETGRVLLDEQPLIGKFKYEGIAFI